MRVIINIDSGIDPELGLLIGVRSIKYRLANPSPFEYRILEYEIEHSNGITTVSRPIKTGLSVKVCLTGEYAPGQLELIPDKELQNEAKDGQTKSYQD
jgi:hypothetical protein